MVYGTESALVLIDIVHKLCLMHISVPAIYGSQELYSRAPRSPKKLDAPNSSQDIPQARSPSIDQVSYTLNSLFCLQNLFCVFINTCKFDAQLKINIAV